MFLESTKPTLVEQQREKRRAIEAAIQQNPGMSDNAIADMLGVHNQTVTKVRRGVKHTDDNRSVRIPEGKTLSVACVRR